jgi:hypothetical protein
LALTDEKEIFTSKPKTVVVPKNRGFNASLDLLPVPELIEMLCKVASELHAKLADHLRIEEDCTIPQRRGECNRRKRRLEKAFEQIKAAECIYRLLARRTSTTVT